MGTGVQPLCGIHLAGLMRADANRAKESETWEAEKRIDDRRTAVAARLAKWGVFYSIAARRNLVIPEDRAVALADYLDSIG